MPVDHHRMVHVNLNQTGTTCTIKYISRIFGWKNLQKQVEDCISPCDSCQKNKITRKSRYRKVPLVPTFRDEQLWEFIQADYTWPWMVQVNNSGIGEINEFIIKVLTLVEQCMCWLEVVSLVNISAKTAASTLDRKYLFPVYKAQSMSWRQ